MHVQYIQECQCGAMTVTFDNGATNSMCRETFERIGFDGERSHVKFFHCNHCVNHWGIDLCECGSGQPVGRCDCGSDKASEKLGMKKPFIGWVF